MHNIINKYQSEYNLKVHQDWQASQVKKPWTSNEYISQVAKQTQNEAKTYTEGYKVSYIS